MAQFATRNGINGSGGTRLIRTDTLTTGEAQALVPPGGAVYAWVKAWGGGGGGAYYTVSGQPAGKGGYAEALVPVLPSNTYYYTIATGGQKGSTTLDGSTRTGGTGGGGDGRNRSGAGGGYTGLFITSVSQVNALLIAAGGGGATNLNLSEGGDGGGSTGEDALSGSPAAYGGTQSAGGSGSGSGSALQGGDATTSGSTEYAGGGGGYYGGGAGYAGAGGSCYSKSTNTHSTLTRGNNTSDADYPGSSVGAAGATGTGPTDGGRGHMIVRWYSGDPFAAGLLS